jgi:hypothetical protein
MNEGRHTDTRYLPYLAFAHHVARTATSSGFCAHAKIEVGRRAA